jgi:hypothetical protein
MAKSQRPVVMDKLSSSGLTSVWIVLSVFEHLHWNGIKHKCCEYTLPVEKMGRSPP